MRVRFNISKTAERGEWERQVKSIASKLQTACNELRGNKVWIDDPGDCVWLHLYRDGHPLEGDRCRCGKIELAINGWVGVLFTLAQNGLAQSGHEFQKNTVEIYCGGKGDEGFLSLRWNGEGGGELSHIVFVKYGKPQRDECGREQPVRELRMSTFVCQSKEELEKAVDGIHSEIVKACRSMREYILGDGDGECVWVKYIAGNVSSGGRCDGKAIEREIRGWIANLLPINHNVLKIGNMVCDSLTVRITGGIAPYSKALSLAWYGDRGIEISKIVFAKVDE